ncbi:MAG: hypothetical protein J5769_05825 [Bacteroidales bacterium]|nr:hypothetical protein [Bacteroidales bacterium]
MKTIFKISALVAAIAVLFSCETYKVGDPDMTAIYKIDGKYMAFAIPEGQTDTTTIFGIVITNTTNDDPDAGWITIVDMDYSYCNWQRLYAVRFKIDIDAENLTFSATNVAAAEPTTAWNPYYESMASNGSMYTATRQWPAYFTLAQSATITDGKVVTDGVVTPSGYKADSIEFKYTLNYKDGTSDSYTLKGQKKTGWGEDAAEFEQWLVAKGW